MYFSLGSQQPPSLATDMATELAMNPMDLASFSSFFGKATDLDAAELEKRIQAAARVSEQALFSRDIHSRRGEYRCVSGNMSGR